MKQTLVILINIYQRAISPDHGIFRAFFPLGVCRFYPSCSEYTRQSIERYGALKGTVRGLSQLLRCHPFSCNVKHETCNPRG